MTRFDQFKFGAHIARKRPVHGVWIMASAWIAPRSAIARGVGSYPPAWSGKASPDFRNPPKWWPFPNS
jgi:hypothetical protein